jgi:succinate dehydrogenase / fumarate reductase cytochrome b subunit
LATSNRPLSPHLQIYRLPLLARMSITHRATGIFLTLGALLIPAVLVAAAVGPDAYQCVQAHLAAWYGQVLLFAISASLIYHLLNGIRHLIWDTGRMLSVPAAKKSGVIVILLTLIVTAGLWVLV